MLRKNENNNLSYSWLFLDGQKKGTNHMDTKSDKRFVKNGNFEKRISYIEGVIKIRLRASLVAQWLRTCLPLQGTRFKPWSGKNPHATEQRSLCATTTEARAPGAPALQQKKPLQ